MKLLRALLAIVLIGCVSCAELLPIVPTYESVEPAFAYYKQTASKTDSNVVIAIISYSSAKMNERKMLLWRDYDRYFETFVKTMQSEKRVSENYPKNPNTFEIRVFERFSDSWMAEYRAAGISADEAQAYYANDAAYLINRISNHEYSRNK